MIRHIAKKYQTILSEELQFLEKLHHRKMPITNGHFSMVNVREESIETLLDSLEDLDRKIIALNE